MQIEILAEPRLYPIPEDVKTLHDFRDVTIVVHEVGKPRDLITGNHLIVEGTEDAIKNWLSPFDGVWVGCGNPMMQQFELMHIK